MKDIAIHTRVNPEERTKRLTGFARRLLTTNKVITFVYCYVNYFIHVVMFIFINYV